MMTILAYTVILIMLITALTVIFKAVTYNYNFSYQKTSTFECGFDLMTKLRLPFSLNFFIISIIFLIFDMELILLMPFIFMMKMQSMKSMTVLLSMFFSVLILGFLYEWWMGLLNWLM